MLSKNKAIWQTLRGLSGARSTVSSLVVHVALLSHFLLIAADEKQPLERMPWDWNLVVHMVIDQFIKPLVKYSNSVIINA